MSSSKSSFTCIWGSFWTLNPSTTTVYARSAFYPSLRFTLSLQSAFYTQSAFYPWSAVCSPQSAVCVLHWPVVKLMCMDRIARQKHESALEGSCSDVIDCYVELHLSNRKLFSSVWIAWYKHERGWENLRQLSKPEANWRVCTTVENSPNPSCVYIRLCKQRKKVVYCFY